MDEVDKMRSSQLANTASPEIQERFKRNPYKHELHEEFIYFTHKDNVEQYEQEGSPIKSQLGVAYTDFMKRDDVKFKDYEEFLQYVDKCKQK